jgi:hypothetical protein
VAVAGQFVGHMEDGIDDTVHSRLERLSHQGDSHAFTMLTVSDQGST